MIKKIDKNKFTIKNIVSFLLYALLFWILIGYIVLPIFNTIGQAFSSNGEFSTRAIKDIFQMKII